MAQQNKRSQSTTEAHTLHIQEIYISTRCAALTLFANQQCNSLPLLSTVHMTVTSKRPTSKSVSSPTSSSSRVRQLTTPQLSTSTEQMRSTPSKLHSQSQPLTTCLPPTSATPLPTAPRASTPKPSPRRWTQSLTFPTGHSKSACTILALLRALTDDGFPRFSHFGRGRVKILPSISPDQNKTKREEKWKEKNLVFNLKSLDEIGAALWITVHNVQYAKSAVVFLFVFQDGSGKNVVVNCLLAQFAPCIHCHCYCVTDQKSRIQLSQSISEILYVQLLCAFSHCDY